MDDKSIFAEVSKVLLDRFMFQMNNERPWRRMYQTVRIFDTVTLCQLLLWSGLQLIKYKIGYLGQGLMIVYKSSQRG